MPNVRVNCCRSAMFTTLFVVITLVSLCAQTLQQPHNVPRKPGDVFYPNDHLIRPGMPGGYHTYHYHHSHSHHGPYDFEDDDITSKQQLNTSVGIPLDFAKRLNDYNVSDLLLNFVEDFDESTPTELASRFGDDAATERNSGKLPKSAKCMPELQTVKIATTDDPNVVYIPQCTRVERCGGCCSHTLLSCQPTAKETLTFQVVKVEYTGSPKFKFLGKELVLVEKHTACKCNCKIKAEDCTAYQEYKETECRCSCKNLDEEKKCYKKSSKKLWNPEQCACQCREIMPCSTGYTFDTNDCRCVQSQVKRRYVLTETTDQKSEVAPVEPLP